VRAPDRTTLPDLIALDAVFLGPIRGWLPPGAPAVIITDDELAGMPFSALRDSARGRFLIEDRSIRFAPSIQSARMPPVTGRREGIYLLADPSFDSHQFPTLNRLPGAISEVEAIAPFYPGSIVLTGGAVTSRALKAAVERMSILHYAGHALFDDRRSERSRLVLAIDSGAPSSLTASDIRHLSLHHVQLVVLSACRTSDYESGAHDGFAGLASSFLSAGAGGVVGSLWYVDDRLTQPLMVAFHRVYHRNPNPASALRSAQLALLMSSDTALRSPAAWAAFRYSGR
jgi:CHAT domain-containing protein